MFNERIIERSYASKHLKRCSKSSAIKETHIKRNTIRYTSYLLGWLQSKEKEKRKEQWIIITSDEKIWTNWNPNTFLSGMGQPIWKTVWYFLTRLKRITIGSSKSIVRYILKGNENMSTKTCAQMFIATLFIIVRRGKQSTVHQLMNGKKCDIFIQWGITQL